MNERAMLLNKIQKYDFSLKELNLYLDTHPDCRRALSLFHNYTALKQKCVDEYTRKYGPIIPEQCNDFQHWAWVDEPWPWERW